MRAVRLVVAVALWPFVYVTDRLHGVDPPASFRAGLEWARQAEVRRDC